MNKLLHTILIVDDNPEFLDDLRAELEASKLFSQVLTTSNGLGALQLVAEQDIELALIDLLMPGMNGLATTAALHRFQPTLPIVIMSNEPGRQRITEAAQHAGARAFLSKAELLPLKLLDYFPFSF